MIKIKNKYFFSIYFILVIIIFVLINIFLKTNEMLFLINIILITFFLILTYTIIYYIYISPIKKTNNIIKYYNDNNFAYTNYGITSIDMKMLNDDLKELGDKLKILTQKNQEISAENQNYYEQYQMDLENKKQLVTSISHEIKTPLAVIEATASALYDDIFPKETEKQELNNIMIECDKTSQMLQEIINIYKLDTTNYKLEAKLTNINTIIEEILEEYHNLIIKYKKDIIILNNLDIEYNVNYLQFKKALENILLNAIIYSPLNEKITINLTTKNNYKALEIINYGITIDKDSIQKIFEPFYRIDVSRTKKEDHGNGLGLYIVKEILEKHELDYGLVNVNDGVKFYIIFPNTEER